MTPPTHNAFQPGQPFDFIVKPTPQFEATIEHIQNTLPGPAFEEVTSEVRRLYGLYTARLTALAPGAARGRELHYLINKAMENAAPKNVSCHRGCAACCSYEVEVTADEAVLLKEAVLGGVTIDRDRLALLAGRERKSTLWSHLGNPENRCVFLGSDGACRVYEQRPAICRKHLVTSPPASCAIPGGSLEIVRILHAEIILSAALAVPGTVCGALPKMVQAALSGSA